MEAETTISALARETGIHRSTLSHIAQGKPAKSSEKEKIAAALGLDPMEMNI